jgi:hypothetical protein
MREQNYSAYYYWWFSGCGIVVVVVDRLELDLAKRVDGGCRTNGHEPRSNSRCAAYCQHQATLRIGLA